MCFRSPPVLQKSGKASFENTYKTTFWFMSESTSPYTLKLLPFNLSFCTKNKGFLMPQFSKSYTRKSFSIKFKYIPDLYTKYPTMIIYSHELWSKWSNLPPFPLPLPTLKKQKATQKLTKTERKKIRMGEFFPGGLLSRRIFFSGDFFVGEVFVGGNFPVASFFRAA